MDHANMNLKFITKNPKPRNSNVNPKMGYKGAKKKITFFSKPCIWVGEKMKWVAARSTYFSRFLTKTKKKIEREKYKGDSQLNMEFQKKKVKMREEKKSK